MLEVENELNDKRNEKIERLTKENQKLRDKLDKNKDNTPKKASANELKKVRDEIEMIQK